MSFASQSIANLSPADQAKFISFGIGPSYVPPFATVHAAFEHQAAQRPSEIAIEHDGKSVTYLELKAMSDRLAVALKQQGVKSGDRVLLLVQRSIAMVAGMLGILKAGGMFQTCVFLVSTLLQYLLLFSRIRPTRHVFSDSC